MTATVIDGKAVAASVRERVRGEVERIVGEIGRPPGLATVLVGDDAASALEAGAGVVSGTACQGTELDMDPLGDCIFPEAPR